MKPSDRLKEIEHIFSVYPRSVISEEMKWLIARVETLTEALEFYADKNNWEKIDGNSLWASNLKIQDCAYFNAGGGRARKALEGDE